MINMLIFWLLVDELIFNRTCCENQHSESGKSPLKQHFGKAGALEMACLNYQQKKISFCMLKSLGV
jgi:hypothetical protein